MHFKLYKLLVRLFNVMLERLLDVVYSYISQRQIIYHAELAFNNTVEYWVVALGTT